MGETRVDLLHLLEDLRDAYTGSLEETILTELIANALDSGATSVTLATDLPRSTFILTDDGSGMKSPELRRYHDVAASAKVRGEGIGFAGVGVKLALLACTAVLTETRRGKSHVASTWHLATRHRAPWKRVAPPGLIADHGTAVSLALKNPLSPLLDAGFLESTLERHYAPLLDPFFSEMLRTRYPQGVRFVVNGRPLISAPGQESRTPISIRMRRKRKPEGWGYLVRGGTLPEEGRGLAVSTLGKVIKRGWDWLGLAPAAPAEIGGLIEVPALAACLALNKTDFIRSGSRGAVYLAYRKAIQQAVSAQLQIWGDSQEREAEEQRRRVRPLQRDLERVLLDLADDFPLLTSLVERRAGGQRRLPVGGGREVLSGAHSGVDTGSEAGLAAVAMPREEAVQAPAPAAGPADVAAPPAPTPDSTTESGTPPGILPATSARRRSPAHYTLKLALEHRAEDEQIARLVESTVRVNSGHPAYLRADASRSLGYHLALAVAMALAPLAVEPMRIHDFVNAFLTRWGEATQRPRRRSSPRRPSGAAHVR